MQFTSGNRTTKAHIAQIIQMAIELKKMTLDGGLLNVPAKKTAADSDNSSDEDEPAETEKQALDQAMKHINDRDWTKFCGGPLKFFEVRWTKKLEDYNSDEEEEEEEHHEDSSSVDS